MTNDVVTRPLVQLGALLLIADGVMGLISSLRPRSHSLLWHVGPELARAVTEELSDHPKIARPLYFAEAAAGLLLAARQARRG